MDFSDRDFKTSNELRKKGHALIPGGAHTYAKGDDQYPVLSPGFIQKGQGCRVWDVDGNEYIEYGMGLRSVTLGHAYPAVVEAAHQQMLLGSNFVRPAVLELTAAEVMLELVDSADMVKFAKNGSDTTTAAVKLARAYTGRSLVAVCTDQPFFSVDDWFIGTTPMNGGVPEAARKLTVGFQYDDLASVQALFDAHPDQVACLIIEAAKYSEPTDNFLQKVQALCQKRGALFILDEMITGFRWHLKGAQHVYGLEPDLSCFGKGIANGFSVAALAGKRDIMALGGLDHEKERVFLLSTTHGAETHALAAMIKTAEIYKEENVVDHLNKQGTRLKEGVDTLIDAYDLEGYFEVVGFPGNLVYATRDTEQQPSQVYRALFLQELIKRGVLAPSFVVSYSHSDEAVDQTIEAVGGALAVYRQALDGGVENYLVGRPVQPVFRRYN